MIGVPFEVTTTPTESPSLFVLAMMVDDAEQVNADRSTDAMKVEVQLQEKKENSPDPLNATIITLPEPQRASTPNVTEGRLHTMLMRQL